MLNKNQCSWQVFIFIGLRQNTSQIPQYSWSYILVMLRHCQHCRHGEACDRSCDRSKVVRVVYKLFIYYHHCFNIPVKWMRCSYSIRTSIKHSDDIYFIYIYIYMCVCVYVRVCEWVLKCTIRVCGSHCSYWPVAFVFNCREQWQVYLNDMYLWRWICRNRSVMYNCWLSLLYCPHIALSFYLVQ